MDEEIKKKGTFQAVTLITFILMICCFYNLNCKVDKLIEAEIIKFEFAEHVRQSFKQAFEKK